jgi:tetratricopeptide (TPR) repeat protein
MKRYLRYLTIFATILLLLLISQFGSCKYRLDLLKLDYVLVKNPNDVQALYNRGTGRYELGDNQGAIADFTKLAKLQPEDIGGHEQLGIIYRNNGDKQRAIEHFQAAADIARRNGEWDLYKSMMEDIDFVNKLIP